MKVNMFIARLMAALVVVVGMGIGTGYGAAAEAPAPLTMSDMQKILVTTMTNLYANAQAMRDKLFHNRAMNIDIRSAIFEGCQKFKAGINYAQFMQEEETSREKKDALEMANLISHIRYWKANFYDVYIEKCGAEGAATIMAKYPIFSPDNFEMLATLLNNRLEAELSKHD